MHTAHRGGALIQKKLVAETEQGIKDAIKAYERQYHPMGYGTRVARKVKVDGGWEAAMTRYESCD